MNVKYRLSTIIIFFIAIYAANGQVQIKMSDQKLLPPAPPVNIENHDARNLWIAKHYWDNINFSKNKNITSEYANPFISTYAYQLSLIPSDSAVVYIEETLQKAKRNEDTYNYVSSSLYEIYDNLVSAYRDDERLAAVLRNILANKNMTDTEHDSYQFRLSMANKNAAGTLATNIGFTDIANKRDSLYNIDSEFTVLLFYSPGCHACEETEKKIKSSNIINNWLESGDLKILAYAADANKEVWEEYQSHIPATWINAYDPNMSVWYKRLYDIKGFPTIYLLDQNKKVVLKDTNISHIEDYLMQQAMTLPTLE